MLPIEHQVGDDDVPVPRPNKGIGKTLLWDTIVVAMACSAVGVIAILPASEPEASYGRYITAPVTVGNLDVKVHATGTVEPTRLIEVSTEISGTLLRVLVKPNDVVKTGQVLAELDPSHLRAQTVRAKAVVAAAKARLQEAKAEVRLSSADLGRKQRLHASKYSSERDLDEATYKSGRATASADRLKAEIEIAEADLQMAQTNLAKSRIVSPVNGVVMRRNAEPGQTIAASLQPPVLFRLAEDLTEMQIRVDVDEADAMSVAAGQSSTFMVQALRNKRFVANVERIHIGPEVVQGVVTYKAILTFDNRRIRLMPGMTATAEIVTHRVRNALLAPNSALRFAPTATTSVVGAGVVINQALGIATAIGAPSEGNEIDSPTQIEAGSGEQRFLHILDGGAVRRLQVDTGVSDGILTVVRGEGLRAGLRVVVDVAETGS